MFGTSKHQEFGVGGAPLQGIEGEPLPRKRAHSSSTRVLELSHRHKKRVEEHRNPTYDAYHTEPDGATHAVPCSILKVAAKHPRLKFSARHFRHLDDEAFRGRKQPDAVQKPGHETRFFLG